MGYYIATCEKNKNRTSVNGTGRRTAAKGSGIQAMNHSMPVLGHLEKAMGAILYCILLIAAVAVFTVSSALSRGGGAEMDEWRAGAAGIHCPERDGLRGRRTAA